MVAVKRSASARGSSNRGEYGEGVGAGGQDQGAADSLENGRGRATMEP